ncbi:glycoside hydrolase family protein [Chitinophaga japonensis]|uniref:hypothetical protein n=1 Tax=Chitinophaga japonensis TaxID=104662 RepID=UPI00119ECDBC|nr:hypothetical protein [Chitinophaga japonensis]
MFTLPEHLLDIITIYVNFEENIPQTKLLSWEKQSTRILEKPGKGKDDEVMGGHFDVVVNKGKAYIFHFTHPRRKKHAPAPWNSFDNKRSVIQLAELKYVNGEIVCDRDEPVSIQLK